MLKAYVDESGIHTNNCEFCCVGGYFGQEKTWEKFEKAWRKTLERYGIEEFHAKRFWQRDPQGNRVNPYRGWDDGMADTFLNRLLDIITNHRIFPTGAGVVKCAWDALSDKERTFLTGGRYDLLKKKWVTTGSKTRPYFLGFQFAIVGPLVHCPPSDKVHFAFDLNEQVRGYALDLYAILKNDSNLSSRDRMGEPSFPTSLEAVQLQAADMLVYQMYQYGKLRITQEHPPKTPAFRRLMTRMKDEHDWPLFNAGGLRTALDLSGFEKTK